MTPAVDMVNKAGIGFTTHSYAHDPKHESYGLEAAEKLGIPPQQVFKTLVVALDGKGLAVGLVPVSASLDLKAVAKALGAKKAAMADARSVQRSTGYVLGGVSPLGQKRVLPTIIDASAQTLERMYVSAGRRGLEIALSPGDLCALLKAEFQEIAK
ncbi:MAG: Cys-tRNA(Pro) deacylase [Candidatus Thiodiazotropha sp.]